jgi:hypothetical protein
LEAFEKCSVASLGVRVAECDQKTSRSQQNFIAKLRKAAEKADAPPASNMMAGKTSPCREFIIQFVNQCGFVLVNIKGNLAERLIEHVNEEDDGEGFSTQVSESNVHPDLCCSINQWIANIHDYSCFVCEMYIGVFIVFLLQYHRM